MNCFGLVSLTLVAISVGITVTSASPSLDFHLLDFKQHYEHLSYIATFPCRTPQPRVIPVHKLFSQSELHNKAYFPDVTVLHRCDESSGCCTSGHHCAALHEETVSLPFKITFLEDVEVHRKGSWLMEYHYFQNHTECTCSEPLPESLPPTLDRKLQEELWLTHPRQVVTTTTSPPYYPTSMLQRHAGYEVQRTSSEETASNERIHFRGSTLTSSSRSKLRYVIRS